MDHIHLQHTLPQVFAARDTVISQVWHQDIVFDKGKRYLIEASSGTGKSSLCSYIYGYRRDYQGIISFDGRNIRSFSVGEWADVRKHSLSILFQELRIFPELTALENVLLKNRLTTIRRKKKFSPFSKQPAFPTKPTKEPASFPSGSSNASLLSAAFASRSTLSSWTNPSVTWTTTTVP